MSNIRPGSTHGTIAGSPLRLFFDTAGGGGAAPPAYGQRQEIVEGSFARPHHTAAAQVGCGLYRQHSRPGAPVGRAASPHTTVGYRVRSRSDGDESLEGALESDDDDDDGAPSSFRTTTPPRRRSISQSSPASGGGQMLSPQTLSNFRDQLSPQMELTPRVPTLLAVADWAVGRPTALSPPSPVRAGSSSAPPPLRLFLDTSAAEGGLHGLEVRPSPGSLSSPLRPQLVLASPAAAHAPPATQARCRALLLRARIRRAAAGRAPGKG